MATSRKRIRLQAAGLNDYIQKVNNGEVEGDFGDSDMLAADEELFNLPAVKKFTDNQTFEFRALMFDGVQTGYAKCTHELCQQRLKDQRCSIDVDRCIACGLNFQHVPITNLFLISY